MKAPPVLRNILVRVMPGLGLPLVLLLAAWLRFSRLGQFDNQYYTAAVASMLKSWHNFLFASFDPGGVVSVDKPPVAFWLDSIPAALLGVSGFSASLAHALAGLGSVALLYLLIKPVFGKAAGLLAALALAVIPVAVAMDSRNEPDSIVSFQVLVAAWFVVRAVRTHRLRWLLAAGIVVGIGFNTKMWIALVPVPALLAYYALAATEGWRVRITRIALAVSLMLVVSLSWAGFVATVSAEQRPYIGSTPDNSIWTLVVEYNGLRRFTAFIGPSPPSPGVLPADPPPPGAGPSPPPPPSPPSSPSIVDLFATPLATQLGGLLLLAVLGLWLASPRLLPPHIYRQPGRWFELVRSPAAGQLVLWGGWLVVGALVFGLAASTRTHPYYLSQLAAPVAAVLAIGLADGWHRLRQGTPLGWMLPVVLAVGSAYQLYLFREIVSGWLQAASLLLLAAAVGALALALVQRVTDTPLAKAAAVAGCLALLVVPLAASSGRTGAMVGGPPLPPATGYRAPTPGGPPPAGAPLGQPRGAPLVETVASFIAGQGDAGSPFVVGALRASEAAPFIIRGIPAVAIGGFSGRDPIFTPASLEGMAREGKLRYFLMPGLERGPDPEPQPAILEAIRRTWQDVSRAARLPPGTLYRYPGP